MRQPLGFLLQGASTYPDSTSRVLKWFAWTASVLLWLLLLPLGITGQSGARNGDWTTYGGDLGSTRYSPLDQINAANFNNLEVAWRFKTDNLGPRPEFNF